jgi:hypothetical protein
METLTQVVVRDFAGVEESNNKPNSEYAVVLTWLANISGEGCTI